MGTTYTDELADALTGRETRPSYRLGPGSGIAQRAVLRETLKPTFGAVRTITQNMTVGLSEAQAYRWGRTLVEIIHAHQAASSRGVYKVTLAQVTELAETIRLARLLTLDQHLTVNQAQRLGLGLSLMASLRLADTGSAAARYHQALAQGFLVSSALSRAIALMLTQTLQVHPVQTPMMWWGGNITQNLTLHEALQNTLVLVLSQDIGLTDDQLVQAIYQGDALLDGVNLGGLYVSPNGMVTTWAVNTRTNAITEYSNFDFNGFAQLGTRYIATSGSGVYELDGDTDDGKAIIADILSGTLQINGTKLSGLKGVYLAMRGVGEVYLKIITGDGHERVYAATTLPGLMNTKIKVGKGIRARYLAFQLTTTGQDFDLDSLEFVPMLSDRRV